VATIHSYSPIAFDLFEILERCHECLSEVHRTTVRHQLNS